jgi:NAD(P)H-flavin reductase
MLGKILVKDIMPNPIKTEATVVSITPHGKGVYTVTMKPKGRTPRFKAGQFLHLSVDNYDPAGGFWPESRVFSIASPPGIETLSIIYSVKGSYTKKMEEALKPGLIVWLKLPYGEFIIDSCIHDRQDVVLIAGGTGVSPYIPYLEDLCSSERPKCIGRTVLYYGARLRSFILFPELITRCLNGVEGFQADIYIENETLDGLTVPGARIQGGRLSIDNIHNESKDLNDPVFFLSGPPAMIKCFKQQLIEKGIALCNIKIDEWE